MFTSLNKIITTTAPDFSVLWFAARDFLVGKNFYLNQVIFTGVGYPPNTLLFYLPFIYFSYQAAQAIFIFLSFASIIISVYLSIKIALAKVPLLVYLPALLLTFLAFPTKFTLGMGQNNSMALLLLLVSYLLYKKGKTAASGIFLGMVIALKTLFGFFFLFFLLKREWKVIVYSLFSLAGLGLLTALISDIGLYGYYIKEVVPPLLNLSGREIYYNQGVIGFISRLTQDLFLRKYLAMAVSTLLIVVMIFTTLKKRVQNLQFSLFTITLLLVDTLSWQHHFIWLIFPFILLTTYALKKKQIGMLILIAISYLFIGWNFENPSLYFEFPKSLLLSNTFYGTFILFLINVYILISNTRSKEMG